MKGHTFIDTGSYYSIKNVVQFLIQYTSRLYREALPRINYMKTYDHC